MNDKTLKSFYIYANDPIGNLVQEQDASMLSHHQQHHKQRREMIARGSGHTE